MQEFEPLDLGAHVDCALPLTKELSESIKSDPSAMYMYSLRCMKRLPDELHEAMLLAAFDPAHSAMVRHYLEWAAACDDRAARAFVSRRREDFHNRSIVVLYCLILISWAALMLELLF